VQQPRVDRHLDRFARREEEVPVEAAEERHRPLEVLDAEGGTRGLGRGVDEICPLERCCGDLDVDKLFCAECFDEKDASAHARTVPAGRLAHLLGTDTDGDAPARVVAQRTAGHVELCFAEHEARPVGVDCSLEDIHRR
jgi:hypothetical protein